MKTIISTANAPAAIGPYSQATEANGLIFISGQLPLIPETGVFPEGGILSEDGKLHHFRPGVFKIAQKAKVPIVVCTLRDTKDVVHNILHFKGSKVELRVLQTIPVEELEAVTTVEISERCHQLMADDLGPDLIAD